MSTNDIQLIAEFAEYINSLDKYSDRFIYKAIRKFSDGRRDHSDQDPLLIDCEHEIEQEEIDIMAYKFIQQKQREINL